MEPVRWKSSFGSKVMHHQLPIPVKQDPVKKREREREKETERARRNPSPEADTYLCTTFSCSVRQTDVLHARVGLLTNPTDYNITIKNTELPVVNVRTIDQPTYLPMQVCEVRPGQLALAKTTPRQTQHMIKFAVRKPAQNARSIVTTGLRLLGLEADNNDPNPYLVSQELFRVTTNYSK